MACFSYSHWETTRFLVFFTSEYLYFRMFKQSHPWVREALSISMNQVRLERATLRVQSFMCHVRDTVEYLHIPPSVAKQIIRNSGYTFSVTHVKGTWLVNRKRSWEISNKREVMRGTVCSVRRAAWPRLLCCWDCHMTRLISQQSSTNSWYLLPLTFSHLNVHRNLLQRLSSTKLNSIDVEQIQHSAFLPNS